MLRVALVVAALLLSAAVGTGTLVSDTRQLMSGVASVASQPSSVVTSSGRVLTALVTSTGQLGTVYCLDVFCRSVRSVVHSEASGVSDPVVRIDPSNPQQPLIAFHHTGRARIAVVRCGDLSCNSTVFAQDLAFVTAATVFQGGIGMAVDTGGVVYILYRRFLPSVSVAQTMLLQCTDITSRGCSVTALATGSDEGSGIGPDSLVIGANNSVIAVWRTFGSDPSKQLDPPFSYMNIAVCPAAPSSCTLNTVLVASPIEGNTPPTQLGLFFYSLQLVGTTPAVLYSAGFPPNTVAHLATCADPLCLSFASVVALNGTFAGTGALNAGSPDTPRFVSGSGLGELTRYNCSDMSCSSFTSSTVETPGGGITWVGFPDSLSGAQINSAVTMQATTGHTYYSATIDMSSVPVCGGQGYRFNGCKGNHETCQTTNLTVGLEGSCQCLNLAGVATASTGVTPGGCCGACSAADKKICVGSSTGGATVCQCADGYQPSSLNWSPTQDGNNLKCVSIIAPTTQPLGLAPGAIGGLVIGLIIGLALMLIVGIILYRRWKATHGVFKPSKRPYAEPEPFNRVEYFDTPGFDPPVTSQPPRQPTYRKGAPMSHEESVEGSWVGRGGGSDDDDAGDRKDGSQVYDFF